MDESSSDLVQLSEAELASDPNTITGNRQPIQTKDTMSGTSVSEIQERGLQYWEGISADENGMLGGIPTVAGFSQISKVDLQGSRNFLAKLGIGTKSGLRVVENAVEGGAGYVCPSLTHETHSPSPLTVRRLSHVCNARSIGRITRGLLVDVAKQIDVVEPIPKFTESLHGVPGVRDIENVGLEKWHPRPDRNYDLVWVQWCVGHLTDDQLVELLIRCKDSLNRNGLIVIKENISTTAADVFDETDSSVTRSELFSVTVISWAYAKEPKTKKLQARHHVPRHFPEGRLAYQEDRAAARFS